MEEKKISYLELNAVGDSISVSRGDIPIASIPANKFSFTVKPNKKGIDIRNRLKIVTGGFWGEILVNEEPVTAENASELIGALIKTCTCEGFGCNGITFANIEGSPDDNTALSEKFDSLTGRVMDAEEKNNQQGAQITALQTSITTLMEKIGELEAENASLKENSLQFDSSNNVILRDGTKILGVTETGNGTGVFISREILGLNKYNPGTDEQFYQVEVGNMHVQTTLNTSDVINVDTEHGREIVQYVSKGGKTARTGDLSETGNKITLSFENLIIEVSRINATEVGAIIRTNDNTNVQLPISRILSGNNTEETIRTVLDVTSSGVVFDQVTVGAYVIGQYWITHNGLKYYIVIGSDDDELSEAWIEIYDGFIINP